jgi:hypothetical protein
MKMQNKLWLALVGTLIVGTGSAQSWTVDANPQASQLTTDADKSAVSVDPATGRVDLVTSSQPPVTLSIQAPGSVNANAQFTVSYTATNFQAVTCTASSTPSIPGWNGTLSGTSSQATAPGSGSVTLSLFCTRSGGANVVAPNVTVNVNPPTNCPGTPNLGGTLAAPVQTVRGQAVISVPRTFADIFGSSFPGETGTIFGQGTSVSLNFNETWAIAFTMPANLTKDGFFKLSESPAGGATGVPYISISPCAGELRNNTTLFPWFGSAGSNQRSCAESPGNISADANWTDLDNNLIVSSQRCQLTPGQTYYLNIGLGCPIGSNACGFRLQTTEANFR